MRNVLQMLAVTTLASACAVVLSISPPAASGTARASKAAAVQPVPPAANRDGQCHIARSRRATA